MGSTWAAAATPTPHSALKASDRITSKAALGDSRTRLFVVLLMVAVTTPGMAFFGASDALDAPEAPLLRYYWLPVYAAIVGLSLLSWGRILRAAAPAAIAALLVGWAWASKDWSVLPEISSRRALALAFTTLLGVYLGARWSGRALPEMLADGFLALAAGSILVAIAAPSVGVQHDGETSGAWRGLFPHKNMLGQWMVLGSVSAAAALFTDPTRRKRRWATLALCTFLLLMCRSKGMLVCWLEVMAVAAVLGLARRGPVWAVAAVWIAGTAGAALAFALYYFPQALLAALGKSPTLTGRTEVWASVMRRVGESPWVGYGFAAFWEKGSIPAEVVKKETGWLVPNAHDGWLDLLLQLGWIGVGLLVAAFAIAIVGCLIRSRARTDGYFGLLFLIYYMSISLSESVLELHNSLAWALFVSVLVFACSGGVDKREGEPRFRAGKRPPTPARPAFDWAALEKPHTPAPAKARTLPTDMARYC